MSSLPGLARWTLRLVLAAVIIVPFALLILLLPFAAIGQQAPISEATQECLDYITENWTDMRPKSLAMAMDA